MEEVCQVKSFLCNFYFVYLPKYVQKLDCTLTFSNPPDFIWGAVSKDELSGAYKDIREEYVDIIAGCHMISDTRLQAIYFPHNERNSY